MVPFQRKMQCMQDSRIGIFAHKPYNSYESLSSYDHQFEYKFIHYFLVFFWQLISLFSSFLLIFFVNTCTHCTIIFMPMHFFGPLEIVPHSAVQPGLCIPFVCWFKLGCELNIFRQLEHLYSFWSCVAVSSFITLLVEYLC